MGKNNLWFWGLLIVLVLFFIWSFSYNPKTEKQSTDLDQEPIPKQTNTYQEDLIDISNEDNQNEEPQEERTNFEVTYVVDGDTIEIDTGERVRLICIDTPEKNEDYYQEAKDYLEDLILNEEVGLVKDKSETDRYGRLLRYVYFDEDFVNEMIVEEGWAKAYPYNPDTTLCPQIQDAEDDAKRRKLGIWSEEEEEQEQEDSSEYICSYNAYNCGDFSTHAEAQEVFEGCGSGDVHGLDRDNDGLACETLP